MQFSFYSKTELIFLSDFQPAIVRQPLISVLNSSMRIKTGTPRFLEKGTIINVSLTHWPKKARGYVIWWAQLLYRDSYYRPGYI